MRIIALVAFLLLWFLNFAILKRSYDVSVYEEYLAFWNTRGALYDGMFLCVAVMFFSSWKALEKSLACFMVIVTAGSFIDKTIFRITDYASGDIVLVILGIIVSVIVYGRTNRLGRSQKLSG